MVLQTDLGNLSNIYPKQNNIPKNSSITEKKTLDFARTLQEAFVLVIKNASSILAAVVLCLVTLWIPYVNVGRQSPSISLLSVELTKHGVYNPLDIFQSKWRRYMGEFFMAAGLQIFPLLISLLFLYIPYVLSIPWSLSFYFLIEKDKVQKIKASNDATDGSKWLVFSAEFVICLLPAVIWGILYGCCSLVGSQGLNIVVLILFSIFFLAVCLATSVVLAAVEKQRGIIPVYLQTGKRLAGRSFFAE